MKQKFKERKKIPWNILPYCNNFPPSCSDKFILAEQLAKTAETGKSKLCRKSGGFLHDQQPTQPN